MTHSPKTAALLALAEGRLSEPGRRRIEAHLAGCEVCRREQAAIALYEQLRDDVRAEEPDLDFDGMEQRLMRAIEDEAQCSPSRVAGTGSAGGPHPAPPPQAGEGEPESDHGRQALAAKRPERNPRGVYVAGGLALAAAALLALYFGSPTPEPRVARAPEPAPEEVVEAPTPPPESPRLLPVITAAAHASRADADGEVLPLDEVLVEGDVIRTGGGGSVHIRFYEGTGARLGSDTHLTLTRARVDGVELALHGGEVVSEVAPLDESTAYLVRSGDYEVEVRGTHFAVRAEAEALEVELVEGVVEVRAPGADPIELRAPARWRSDGEANEGEPELPRAHGLGEDEPRFAWVSLSHPNVVRWELPGLEFGAASAGLRAEPGILSVTGFDLRGRRYVAEVLVGAAPVTIDAALLEEVAPRSRAGTLDPGDVAPVVQRSRIAMQRCYERSLRRGPDIEGSLRMRVDVGFDGGVRRVRILDGANEVGGDLAECLTTIANAWSFPAPGGPVSFDVPLSFRQRGRGLE